MKEAVTIGVDLAKSVFQVHGVDSAGEVVIRRQLKRRQVLPFFKKQPPCLVGMEACATSHHWAREITKLGHEVKLMRPRSVKPYVKRNKNDAAAAEAICEAVTRPTMRFVPIKTLEQQSVLIPAPVARGRRFIGDPAGQGVGLHTLSLAGPAHGTTNHQDRRRRACQQDRPHGLGDDGAWDSLQAARRAGRLKHAGSGSRTPGWKGQ
jgi:hypothetical protein